MPHTWTPGPPSHSPAESTPSCQPNGRLSSRRPLSGTDQCGPRPVLEGTGPSPTNSGPGLLTQFFIFQKGQDPHFLSWEAADSERKGFCSYKNRPVSPLFLVLFQMFLMKRCFRLVRRPCSPGSKRAQQPGGPRRRGNLPGSAHPCDTLCLPC